VVIDFCKVADKEDKVAKVVKVVKEVKVKCQVMVHSLLSMDKVKDLHNKDNLVIVQMDRGLQ